MQTEKRFDQAVTLAAAFVANGDLRVGGDLNADTPAMDKLQNLIATLYVMLGQALDEISRDARGV